MARAWSIPLAGIRWAAAAALLAIVPVLSSSIAVADDGAPASTQDVARPAGAGVVPEKFLRRWDPMIAQHWLLTPLRWCGQRSYSIYLTHFLLVVVTSCWLALGGLTSEWQVATIVVPVCLLLSLPVAVLFYWGVERHFMNSP